MELGSYCQEGTIDCLIMMISSLLIFLDMIRLIVMLVKTSHTARNSLSSPLSTIQQVRGQERKIAFRFKIAGAMFTMAITIGQISIWVLINRSSQSIILLQMFCINLISGGLWIWALNQDKKYKGYTKLSTQINMHVNLLLNSFIALLGARNSFDNNDSYAFYLYVGYIAAQGMHQIFIKSCQKDFDSISLDELESKDSSQFSIDQQRKTTSNNEKQESTKIDTGGLTENLLSGLENQPPETNKVKASQPQNNNLPVKNSEKQGYQPTNNGKAKSKRVSNDNKPADGNSAELDKENKFLEKRNSSSSNKPQSNANNNNRNNNQMNNGIISRNTEGTCYNDEDDTEETKICKYRIDNIRIEQFIETIKYSKKTIVYEIKCTYKGKMHLVKRSFREFSALNSALKQANKDNKDKKFPQFPQKKAQNSILTYSDLEERKKLLCAYLQNLNQIIEHDQQLIDFMTQNDSQSCTSPTWQNNNNNNNNNYGNNSPQSPSQMRNGKKSIGEEYQQSANSSISSYNYNIPEVIWEEEELNLSASSHE